MLGLLHPDQGQPRLLAAIRSAASTSRKAATSTRPSTPLQCRWRSSPDRSGISCRAAVQLALERVEPVGGGDRFATFALALRARRSTAAYPRNHRSRTHPRRRTLSRDSPEAGERPRADVGHARFPFHEQAAMSAACPGRSSTAAPRLWPTEAEVTARWPRGRQTGSLPRALVALRATVN
jgi:hypothetical protein